MAPTQGERISALEATVLTLKQQVEELQNKLSAVETANKDKDKRIEELEKNHGDAANQSATFWSKLPKNATNAISNIASKESNELARKEKNLIICGLKEQGTNIAPEDRADAEKASVVQLLTSIGINDENNPKVTRFKSNNNDKPGQILVECSTREIKFEILKAAKKLKDSSHTKGIYINPDLTPAQIASDKKLRKERKELNDKLTLTGEDNLKYGMHKFGTDSIESKFYWGIRNGELKKIKIL